MSLLETLLFAAMLGGILVGNYDMVKSLRSIENRLRELKSLS